MKITIKFYSGFEKYLQNSSNKVLELFLESKEDIFSILNRFLPEDAIDFVGIILVNRKIVNFCYQVREGDKVEIFPIIGGG